MKADWSQWRDIAIIMAFMAVAIVIGWGLDTLLEEFGR